jgi:hypothetical protein
MPQIYYVFDARTAPFQAPTVATVPPQAPAASLPGDRRGSQLSPLPTNRQP